MARFGPVITAMVTPFDDDGAVDLDGAAALAHWLVEQGNDGLVVTGTTGEARTLTDDEQVDAVADGAGRGRRAAHRRHRHQRHPPRRRAHRQAAATGIDARARRHARTTTGPPQAGIEAHFRAVAAATDLPVMLYDIPVRTGRKIATELLAPPGPRGAQHRRP